MIADLTTRLFPSLRNALRRRMRASLPIACFAFAVRRRLTAVLRARGFDIRELWASPAHFGHACLHAASGGARLSLLCASGARGPRGNVSVTFFGAPVSAACSKREPRFLPADRVLYGCNVVAEAVRRLNASSSARARCLTSARATSCLRGSSRPFVRLRRVCGRCCSTRRRSTRSPTTRGCRCRTESPTQACRRARTLADALGAGRAAGGAGPVSVATCSSGSVTAHLVRAPTRSAQLEGASRLHASRPRTSQPQLISLAFEC
eukprot:826625-Pleurochrysis_carterae.AAC.6